jgi:hypothetical protein
MLFAPTNQGLGVGLVYYAIILEIRLELANEQSRP